MSDETLFAVLLIAWIIASRLAVVLALHLGVPKLWTISIPIAVVWALTAAAGLDDFVSTSIKLSFMAPLIVYLRWWWWPPKGRSTDVTTARSDPPER